MGIPKFRPSTAMLNYAQRPFPFPDAEALGSGLDQSSCERKEIKVKTENLKIEGHNVQT